MSFSPSPTASSRFLISSRAAAVCALTPASFPTWSPTAPLMKKSPALEVRTALDAQAPAAEGGVATLPRRAAVLQETCGLQSQRRVPSMMEELTKPTR